MNRKEWILNNRQELIEKRTIPELKMLDIIKNETHFKIEVQKYIRCGNKIYFVDSSTSKDSMATFAALERDMKILEREVFIDDVISRSEMLKQILRGIDIANKKGKVIMIG